MVIEFWMVDWALKCIFGLIALVILMGWMLVLRDWRRKRLAHDQDNKAREDGYDGHGGL